MRKPFHNSIFAMCNHNQVLTLVMLFISQAAFTQNMEVEAVYYDKFDIPYKIERKYIDNNVVTYVTHYNQSSVCVKQQTFVSGDTTIIKETYYSVAKTKFEKFLDCDHWEVSSNKSGDTVTLTGYRLFLEDTMVLIGDTILTGDAAKNYSDFSEHIEKARVPAILNHQMTVSLDSLLQQETVCAYYLNNIPIKVETFGKGNKKTQYENLRVIREKIDL